jgi:pyruvate, orthophosphate dikinase
MAKKKAGKAKTVVRPAKPARVNSGGRVFRPGYVYQFGKKTDGNGTMKPLLGGKGANLAEMCRIGLPVPPGFTITTDVCTYYYANKRSYPPALKAQMQDGIAAIEKQTGKKFGDLSNPLLVSVRSGARDSMPGMMDTILNLGLNDKTVEALSKKTGNPRFAWDCYRRFVQMYGDVVLGVQKRPDEDHEPFETVIDALKHERYHAEIEDTALTVDDLKELVVRFKALVKERAGRQFPDAPWDQLNGAVGAVFGLSPQVQHPDRMGNGRQRSGDGLRQHGRPFRIGCGVHPESRQRRQGVLRRIPDQRAG